MKRFNPYWLLCATVLAALGIALNVSPRKALHAPDSVSTAAHPAVEMQPKVSPEQRAATLKAFGKLPMMFEKNSGQVDRSVSYFSRGDGYCVYLRPTETVLSLRNNVDPNRAPAQLNLKLLDARPDVKLTGLDQVGSVTNYFIGQKSFTGIANFNKVRGENVYAGIDAVYYGNQKQLEYDFVVAPGADYRTIRMALNGASKASIDAAGNLIVEIGDVKVSQHKPVIYQEKLGRQIIEGGYCILDAAAPGGPVVGFKVGAYDATQPLVIDPVLVYSTYYGDTPLTDHSGDDVGLAVAVDSTGAAYVVGKTSSIEFQLLNPLITLVDVTHPASDPLVLHRDPFSYHGFVSKFSPDGSKLIYSTYLCSVDGVDALTGVVVDAQNNCYVCGWSTGSGYPLANALHVHNGGKDAVLTKIDPNGGNILFSTYIGGGKDDQANDIALDPSGNIVVVGTTFSADFVNAHALFTKFGGVSGTNSDAWLAKFSNDGSTGIFSTFLGGDGDEEGNGVAIDTSGSIYVTGSTTSTNFPISNPYQTLKAAGKDAFVSKFNNSGSVLVFSTYLGGDGDDIGYGIAVDVAANVYVTGSTSSTNYPTISPTVLPVQTTNGGPPGTTDAFVSKLNVFGTSLIFSTYLGGNQNDVGRRIRVDSRNAIYVSGETSVQAAGNPNTFPIYPTGGSTIQVSHAGLTDGFLAKFNPTGNPLVFSTYVGSDFHLFYTDNMKEGCGIISVSEVGTTATLTSVNGLSVKPGDTVVISGTSGVVGSASPYDGTYPVLSVISPKQFTYTLSSAGQSAINNNGSPIKGAVVIEPAQIAPTSVHLYGMTIDNSGNAYITGSTDGSYYVTFGAYSDRANLNVIPGEDFPAPYLATRPDPNGGSFSVPFPKEAGDDFDESDVIISKIFDNSPLITSPLLLQGIKGQTTSYIITATNTPQSFDAAGLPPGLTVDTASGVISGTPTLEGTYQAVISATNASGTGAQILFIVISTAKPVITSATFASGTVGQVFQFQLTAANNPGTFAFTPVAPSVGLPPGLSLDPITGLISGLPVVQKSCTISVTASNSSGTSDPQQLVITILPAPPVISSPLSVQAVVNVPFTYTITATGNPDTFSAFPAGGSSPLPLPLTISLPNGLTLDTGTGIISGTPTTLGFLTLTITAHNAGGTGSNNLEITIIPAQVPIVNSNDVAIGVFNEPFTFKITATNNPLSFGIGGALPAGLTLDDQTGIISGTIQVPAANVPTNPPAAPNPPAPQTVFNLTQSATNTAGTGSRAFTLTVNPPLVPAITSPLSATAQVGAPFEYDIVGSNHPTNYSAFATPVTGFNGLSVDFSTGKITGTPTAGSAGVYNVPISATNCGGTGSATLVLTINPQPIPVITSANQATGNTGIPFSYQIVATNNPMTFGTSVLPAGLTLSASGLISGIPQVATNTTITLSATNNAGTGTKNLSLVITAAQKPVFTCPSQQLGADGATVTYTISATGTQPIVFTASPLPAGLNLVGSTIQGVAVAGITQVTLTAYNPATNPATPGGPNNPAGNSPPVTTTVTFNISPTAAAIVLPSGSVTWTVGVPATFLLGVTGTAPINLSTSALPSGMALVGNSIQGTPTPAAVTSNGPLPVTITVSNAYNKNPSSVSALLNVTVLAALPAFTSSQFAQGTDGVPFRYQITATGTQIITYAIKASTPLPAGLSLTGSVISGTPSSLAIGLTNVQIDATNKGGTSTFDLAIEIDPAAPVITSPASVTGSAGVPFSFQLTATGSPQIDFGVAPSLPGNLSLVTDKIVGTPLTAGTYNVIVTATNAAGGDAKPLQIVITPAPPTISAATITIADQFPMTPYQLLVTGATPITYAATGLPLGLALDPNTGIISGTPNGVGTYVVTVSATNSGGATSQTIVIKVVSSAPKITSALNVSATPNVPFLYTITATGTPVITFQAFNLPTGLSLSGATISGTPTAPVGIITATLVATSPYGSDTQNLDINLQQTPPTITNVVLQANGLQGVPFSFTLTAKGSPAITFGATPLPGGLSIDPTTGVISGIPTVTGSFSVQISATNAFGSDTGKILALSISAAPPKLTNALSANAGLQEPFSFTLTATGTAPITFSAQNLPPGLLLDSNTGAITGAPTVLGTQQFTIKATNSVGSDSKTFTLNVVAHPPIITSPLTATASPVQLFTYVITATGLQPITFTATGLPPGLTFSGNTISGTPTVTAGVYDVTLTATNAVGMDTETLVITISGDSDGDGFPDDWEIFLGTDPNNPLSNPFAGGKGNIRVLNITSMKVALNFKNAASDTINAKGTLQLDNGFNPAGQKALLYVSGVMTNITLPASGPNSFALHAARGRTAGVTFTLNLTGDFKKQMARVGMTNENVLSPRTVTTQVLVFVYNTLYRSDKVLNYTAHAGKNGLAK